MVREYIEIVHVKGIVDLLGKQGPTPRAIADRILELERTEGVTHEMGDLKGDPNLPKDTPIRIGGMLLELCVNTRAINLRLMGYTKVRVDRSISFSAKEIYRV